MMMSSHLGKKARVLFICLCSLVLLVSLCFTVGAVKDEELLLTLHPDDMTSLNGSGANFTWDASGSHSLTRVNFGGYSGKAILISKGLFKINDPNKLLENHQAVILSADLYFSAFPSGIYSTTENGVSVQYTCDPKNDTLPFQSQSVLTWLGTSYDGIRIDSEGNLYSSTSLSSAIGAKLEANTWHNLKLIYSAVSNNAEVWVDGKRVGTVNCRYRENSEYVRFFDGKFSYSAYIKNISLSASDTVYYTGIVKEASSDFLSYQTTKPAADGSFKLRIVAGVDDLRYSHFGYRVLVLTKDASGNTVTKELTGTDDKAYSSFFGGNTKYSVKDAFGYQYACLATLENLDKNSKFTELVIFPYTVSYEGNKIYGTPISLVYTGATDSEGYPLFVKNGGKHTSLTPTDDTIIYYGTGYTDTTFGSNTELMVRNTGGESANLYRAAYFKFTVPKETVDKLDSMANVFLRVYVKKYEDNEKRTKYPLVLFASSTGWEEETLTYNTRRNAVRGTEIDRMPGEACGGYTNFDILDYLKSQPKNADGSLTVAFCVTQEDGHYGNENTRMLYIYSKEHVSETTMPYISFEETLYGRSVTNLKSANVGYEPLSFAETLADEWFDKLYPELYLDENGNRKYHDELGEFAPNGYAATEATGDFTHAIDWKTGVTWQSTPTQNPLSEFLVLDDKWSADRFARTLSTLGTSTANAYLSSSYAKTATQYDSYGGITNLGFKGTATGFFHTEKNPKDGRTYIIDPLGNPYFATSVNTVVYGTADTKNQQQYIIDAYETPENFFREISASLREIGVNTAFVSSSNGLLAVKENGLAVTVSAIGIGDYMGKLGRSQVSEGIFPNNNTINAFDPDLVGYLNKKNYDLITQNGYAEMDNLFGYTADNELPSGTTILERYLTMDPSIPENAFSYHTAWAWFARRIDKVNPTLHDLRTSPEYDAMNSEFLGFLYARYYKVVSDSIRAADPNHMYLGSRVNGTCPKDEGFLRAAGKYLDIIAINLYGGLNPEKETISGIYYYSGKPFIVTEFFAKGLDTIDANGLPLATSTGAGILVHKQEDRAVYYESYVLNLLESKSCVGWSWYRFRDNDQNLYRVIGKDGTVYENVRFLSTTFGENPRPNSLMTEDGKIYWLSFFYDGDPIQWESAMYGTGADAKPVFTKTYSGEALASNQNINKGFYNNNFSSVVTVYSYNADGTLVRFPDGDDLYTFGSKSYEVQHPTSASPADGTVLTSKDGKTSFTLGKKTNADGSYTVTELTVYKGRYITLTDTIQKMSNNLVGLIGYLDNN